MMQPGYPIISYSLLVTGYNKSLVYSFINAHAPTEDESGNVENSFMRKQNVHSFNSMRAIGPCQLCRKILV
jgi:hypothetical protein